MNDPNGLVYDDGIYHLFYQNNPHGNVWGDAPALTKLLNINHHFLAPWDPRRQDEFFTIETQQGILEGALEAHSMGTMVPLAILDDSGELVGRININGITREPSSPEASAIGSAKLTTDKASRHVQWPKSKQ